MRTDLLTRIRRDGAPVLVLDAPVGYGKTTLLRQWAEADPRPVRWIPLDGSHDDPAVLLGDVLGALNATEPVDGNVVAGPVDDRAFLVGVVLPRLVRILRNQNTCGDKTLHVIIVQYAHA